MHRCVQDDCPNTPLTKKKPDSPSKAPSSKLSPVKSQICPRRIQESRPASFGEVKQPAKMLLPAKRPILQPKVEGDAKSGGGEAQAIVESDRKMPKDGVELEDPESEEEEDGMRSPI